MNPTGVFSGIRQLRRIALTVLVIGAVTFSCNNDGATANESALRVSNMDDASWSERMAVSIMQRNPESWMTDFQRSPQWSYTHGLIMMSFLKLWQATGKQEYFDYAKSYADTMIDSTGKIKDYRIDEFNIDNINPGKFLFTLYDNTEDEKYLKAIQTLRRQIEWQPRTSEGGFWHKLRYPWQMWLDGLYMGAPFYAEYTKRFGEAADFDDIALQFRLIQTHTRDTVSGLMYHGWDESRVQRWADPETGLSPHFWGRAMGWYGMALVDVLDHMPQDHPGYEEIQGYLGEFVEAVAAVQDKESGLWYQILDMPEKEGNYLEATVSCMFVYAIAKAVNNKYVDPGYIEIAKKGYDGILKDFVEVDPKGQVHLNQCCSVAGLGGSPYRDGSYDYYISEEVRSNDPKGTGPFILAVLEMEKNAKYAQR